MVPTPSGEPFTQALAAELAAEPRLVFACGRYEGIDQRVLDDAAERGRVRRSPSATTCSTAARSRRWWSSRRWCGCCPASWATPSSLAEESHGADALLEYPVYTKPASWRGHDVPEVLLSGDHARIAAWRHDQSLRRTAARRPDLLHPSRTVTVGGDDLELRTATRADAGELLTLQRACWVREAQDNPGVEIPALLEGLADVRPGSPRARRSSCAPARLVGAVRGTRSSATPGTSGG